MIKIDLILFASELHDKASTISVREKLFNVLGSFAELSIHTIKEYISIKDSLTEEEGKENLTICFIATGGSEEIFATSVSILKQPILLMSDAYHNSLAAAFEICAWLTQNNIKHQHINVPLDISESYEIELENKIKEISKKLYFKHNLQNQKIGVIDGPSYWLIASKVNLNEVSKRYSVEFINISTQVIHKLFLEFKKNYESFLDEEKFNKLIPFLENGRSKEDLIDAYALYLALKEVCEKNELKAITVKCFDMLSICNTTACLALSLLNDEGIISGCEGDMPSLITMMVVELYYNKKCFMANPSSIDKDSYTIDFAHCTIPLSLIKTFTLPTHFESNLGIAIRGKVKLGRYSIVKIGGDNLTKHFSYQGTIIDNTKILQRCRTQVRFQFDSKSDFNEFINNKLGNHVLIAQGEIKL